MYEKTCVPKVYREISNMYVALCNTAKYYAINSICRMVYISPIIISKIHVTNSYVY